MRGDENPPDSADGPALRRDDSPSAIAAALFGDLRCVSCGYNLKGLSIRSSCPECGVAVRATVLAVVDPRADELTALRRPWLAAFGVVGWVWLALASALAVWVLRASEFVGGAFQLSHSFVVALNWVAVLGVAGSGACLMALVKPDDRSHRVAPLVMVALIGYVPLVWLVRFVLLVYDPGHGAVFRFVANEYDPVRSMMRVGVWLSIVVIIVGMRPRAKRLFFRSYVIRTGRAPNQPLSAVLAAVGVAVLGDAIGIGGHTMFRGSVADGAVTVGMVLSSVGAFLLLAGLFGLTVDVWRVGRAILRPPPGLVEVFSPEVSADAAR
ncbi:MAG: hypothetical protein CMJ31_14170 [Phycisphaerae bacterium]|nr:hypothetical protein [Phycisphaerae bacterium]